MKRRNLIAVLTCSFFVLAMVAAVAAFGLSQPAEKAGDSSRYSEREAYISKLRQRQDDTSAVKTGWLILEGRLVEPPYNIDVTDSSVTVNGMDVFVSKAKKLENEVVQTKSSISGYYKAIVEARDIFNAVRDTRGFADARDSMLDFLLHQESIDTAYFLTETVICYRDTGHDWDREIWLRTKPDTSLLDHARNNQSKLRVYANMLIVTLNEGALVIRENGRGHAISYPESETALQQLRAAAATIPDFDERKKRIEEIIGKEKYAEKIAREFK